MERFGIDKSLNKINVELYTNTPLPPPKKKVFTEQREARWTSHFSVLNGEKRSPSNTKQIKK